MSNLYSVAFGNIQDIEIRIHYGQSFFNMTEEIQNEIKSNYNL